MFRYSRMWFPTSLFDVVLPYPSPRLGRRAIAGRAFTVWTALGDNLFLHKAFDAAEPGDVLVVNGSGDTTRALIGNLIGIRAKTLGIVGFVSDGAVRDTDALSEPGLPVFARNVTPAGPYKNGPGRLGEPVAVGSVVVAPGDVVVADADGVVIVKSADVESVHRWRWRPDEYSDIRGHGGRSPAISTVAQAHPLSR